MTTVVAFETARAEDAPAIAALVNLAYRVEDFFKAADRTSEAEVRQLLVDETFLIARADDGSLAGVVRVSVHGDVGHFGMLAVAPQFQGRGLGRALVEAAEAWGRAAGCTTMTLEVASPRTELPPFYARLGYEPAGTKPWPETGLHELKQPAHFLVMSKSLGPLTGGIS